MRRIQFVLFLLSVLVAQIAHAATLPANFQESTIYTGLLYPTVVKFASDGRVFVAEKSGLIKVFASLTSTTPTILADLRPQVQDYWDRGLLGMELDPGFPARPYVYVLYALDKNPADPAATVPTWGDTCPTPPGGTSSGCPVLGRVSRLNTSGTWPVQATEQVLLEGFAQQFPSHSVGSLAFGTDGALYVTAGEGASFTVVDYGQLGGGAGPAVGQRVPVNPLRDPPGAPGVALTPPTAQGGALRSQSMRRPAGQPVLLNGVLLRIDPNTGAALPDNPSFSATDANARRIVAYGLRNPFRFAPRPGTNEMWIGDVGWTNTEEINRFDVSAGVSNFGWPCYEGAAVQSAYQAAGLSACVQLVAEGSARPPFYSYEHTDPIVPGESCPVGTSSVSGLAFYTGSGYPTTYRGALFFTDWARRCIWAMLPDPVTNTPDPARIVTFASGLSGGSVNIERGPGGDLFYVDYDGGRVQRIRYFGANQPPLTRVTASSTSGASPLIVQFDASTSSDPEGGALTFKWDLDDDGALDDSTAVNPTWTFTTSGKHNVHVESTDPQGNTSSADIAVYADNLPPHVSIVSPVSSLMWKVGQPIAFAGEATDGEDGVLPPSTYRWTLLMHHCPAACHTHTVQSFAGFSSGTFNAPDHDYPSWIELQLTVTDAGGLTATASVDLQPQTVSVTFDSVPSGLLVAVGTGSAATPFVRTVIVGSANSVSAPSPQSIGGIPYGLKSWSDAGAATHLFTAPALASTLVATFRPVADLTLTAVAPVKAVQGGRLTTTLTARNTGPATATAVQISLPLPAGMNVISTTPDGACVAAAAVLNCGVNNLAPGASGAITLVLRPLRAGATPLTATVSSAEVDVNTVDNSTTSAVSVRPVGDVNGDGREDLIWQNSGSGSVTAMTMNGATAVSALMLSPDRGP